MTPFTAYIKEAIPEHLLQETPEGRRLIAIFNCETDCRLSGRKAFHLQANFSEAETKFELKEIDAILQAILDHELNTAGPWTLTYYGSTLEPETGEHGHYSKTLVRQRCDTLAEPSG